MAQYIYMMNKVSKIIPLKREVLKDIFIVIFPTPQKLALCWLWGFFIADFLLNTVPQNCNLVQPSYHYHAHNQGQI